MRPGCDGVHGKAAWVGAMRRWSRRSRSSRSMQATQVGNGPTGAWQQLKGLKDATGSRQGPRSAASLPCGFFKHTETQIPGPHTKCHALFDIRSILSGCPHMQSTRPILLGPSKADNAGNVIKVRGVYQGSKVMGMMLFPPFRTACAAIRTEPGLGTQEMLTPCPLPPICFP